MTDITWVGRVSDISYKSGQKQNGDQWTKTNFKFTKIIPTREGNREVSTYLYTFNNFNLADGYVYQMGIDVRNDKDQNGNYKLGLYAVWAEPIALPQPQNNGGYQNNNYQNNGYQQSYQEQPQRRPQYEPPRQEFDNDDIPF